MGTEGIMNQLFEEYECDPEMDLNARFHELLNQIIQELKEKGLKIVDIIDLASYEKDHVSIVVNV